MLITYELIEDRNGDDLSRLRAESENDSQKIARRAQVRFVRGNSIRSERVIRARFFPAPFARDGTSIASEHQ